MQEAEDAPQWAIVMSSHPHDHTHARAPAGRLAAVLALLAGYMVAEVVGGYLAGALALLADAAHMLSDVAAVGLSLFAMWFARRRPGPQRTYGYYRAEILAALANAATLLAIVVYILVEAYRRLRQPSPVEGPILMGVAVGGLVVNLAGLWLLRHGKEANLNMRGAWLHILTDALGSVGAILAGILVLAFAWNWADPAISILIGLLVLYSAWGLLKESVAVLMESAPRRIDVDEVRDAIMSVAGVVAVHDLHVWTITSGLDALSVHVVAEAPHASDLLSRIREMLRARFGIDHQTIQLEPVDFDEHRAVV